MFVFIMEVRECNKKLIIYINYKFVCKDIIENGRAQKKNWNSNLYIDEGKTTICKEQIKHDHPPPKNQKR